MGRGIKSFGGRGGWGYSSAPSDEGYSPAATSRVSSVAQMVVFGAVMADALMLEAVLEADFGGRERVV